MVDKFDPLIKVLIKNVVLRKSGLRVDVIVLMPRKAIRILNNLMTTDSFRVLLNPVLHILQQC